MRATQGYCQGVVLPENQVDRICQHPAGCCWEVVSSASNIEHWPEDAQNFAVGVTYAFHLIEFYLAKQGLHAQLQEVRRIWDEDRIEHIKELNSA